MTPAPVSPAAVLDVLKLGLSRVSAGWCQGSLAKDASGMGTFPTSPRAVAWCAAGACHTGSERLTDVERAAMDALVGPLSGSALTWWNDSEGTTQVQIIDRFRATIARLEAA